MCPQAKEGGGLLATPEAGEDREDPSPEGLEGAGRC